jgi:hypothetical protein
MNFMPNKRQNISYPKNISKLIIKIERLNLSGIENGVHTIPIKLLM